MCRASDNESQKLRGRVGRPAGHDEALHVNVSVSTVVNGFYTLPEVKTTITCMPKKESATFRYFSR